MKKIPLLASALLLLGIGAAKAQLATLHNFPYDAYAYMSLTQSGNVFYGMTDEGGTHQDGNIFSINTDGTNYTDLFDFADTGTKAFHCNGYEPDGNLILIGNTLFGFTDDGGLHHQGTIFSIHTDGTHYRDLLDCDDTGAISGNWGAKYTNGTLLAIGHKLYGMSSEGGVNGYGNIFSIDTSYTLDSARKGYKDLWDFNYNNDSNGAYPYGALTLSLSGKVFYGMTEEGGIYDEGNVFSIDTNGKHYKDLHDFAGNPSDGSYPYADLTLLANKLYGVTGEGGYHNDGTIFKIDTNGRNYTPLYDFNYTPDGEEPYGDLTIAGNIMYGTNYDGGPNGYGNIFSIDTSGNNYTILHSFSSDVNGGDLDGNLTLTGGSLYGMTSEYGTLGGGTIFKFDVCGMATTNVTTSSTPDGGTADGSATANVTGNGPTPYTYLWAPGGQTTATISGLAAGSYTVTVTSANGCQTTEVVNVNSNTGIASISGNSGISVYPNPTNGSFTIKLSDVSGQSSVVEVYNMIGQQVYTQSLTLGNNTMNMNASNGVYMYRIISTEGNLIGQGKLVIQK